VIKLWGFVMFVAEKNRGRIRNKRGREEGHLSGHKSNITDGFNQHI